MHDSLMPAGTVADAHAYRSLQKWSINLEAILKPPGWLIVASYYLAPKR